MMKLYDLHVHSHVEAAAPDVYLAKLQEAGIYGSAVFSPSPSRDGLTLRERLDFVMDFCGAYPGRLFPVLFIHPDDDGAIEMAKEAVGRGIAGFKMICNSYCIFDQKPMELVTEIAALGKPICFHSGILWDGAPSGNFNRPVNWECLLDVPGLKFSLAHCSWPWYDECIALYGKIQNAYRSKPGACEMFFDLTPGTPVPYRRDLLTKLFTVGYDVKHNIMFGTDCSTDYNPEWANKWQDIDNGLYRELGVDDETRQYIYEGNFLRFFGVTKETYKKAALTSDGRI